MLPQGEFLPLTPLWQTHIHAFAGQRGRKIHKISPDFPVSCCPQERMLLRKRGAGDESPAGAVGQRPTVLRSCGLGFYNNTSRPSAKE